MWNLKFSIEPDDEKRAQLGEEAKASLNEQWPFVGDVFMVSGKWYGREMSSDLLGIHFSEIRAADAFTIAQSAGFALTERRGIQTVGFAFYAETLGIDRETVEGALTTKRVAPHDESTLAFVRSAWEDENALIEGATEGLLSVHGLFKLQFRPNSTFYRVKHAKQLKFVTGLLDQANEAATAPGHSLPFMTVSDRLITRTNTSSPYGFRTMWPEEGQPNIYIEGELLGATLIERELLDAKPFTSPKDFIYPEAGLTLIIKPLRSSVDPKFLPPQVLVPIGHCYEIGLGRNYDDNDEVVVDEIEN
ncbi:MAG: hypothetical protein JWO41_529 [Candidatus Saccharibacteria bacterium]|nr:hypothetical protein [Candidatus Saccharibacteria bacterium]